MITEKKEQMKNKTKMWMCLVMVVLFAILGQIVIGNEGAWIAGGLFLFGMGFGWYASKAKEDERK